VLLVSIGAAIADAENFNMLNPSRSPKLEDVALMRLHQRSRYRRYLTWPRSRSASSTPTMVIVLDEAIGIIRRLFAPE
jgi:hypothetical protein